MIDITITATRRAEILSRTLASFKKNLFQGAPALALAIINIDPVGPDPIPGLARAAARKFFPAVLARAPRQASFPKAFKWVWSQTTSDFVFHLEDDWELLRPIDLDRMIEVMDHNPDLAILRLPWKRTDADSMKNWKYFFPWNGEFFECPEHLKREIGFCGHPSLIRGEFVRNAARLLDDTKNPEKQFHHGAEALLREVDKWRYGVFAEPNEPPAIRDIGREWMIENGWQKAGNKAHFTSWERKI